jgi:hypothetical protein
MIKALVRSLLPAGYLAERERRRAQVNWTEQLTAAAGGTKITFCIPKGLGDRMIARQFLEEFESLGSMQKLGLPPRVVIVAGAWSPKFMAPKGDLNLYWWWSMGGRRDWLAHYASEINVRPDLVLCLSDKCAHEAKALGFETLLLPLGVGRHFQPPRNSSREGIGYAGSKGHKDAAQMEVIIGPFQHRSDFRWVDNLGSPAELADFYGSCALVLGMTERLQEEMGMVNNRVFEVLATDTPFLLHRHRHLENLLGFEYRWQASSADEAHALGEEALNAPDVFDFFRQAGASVREKHSWRERLLKLSTHLVARK